MILLRTMQKSIMSSADLLLTEYEAEIRPLPKGKKYLFLKTKRNFPNLTKYHCSFQMSWIIMKHLPHKASICVCVVSFSSSQDVGWRESRQFIDKTTHRHGFWRQFIDTIEDNSSTLFEDNSSTHLFEYNLQS